MQSLATNIWVHDDAVKRDERTLPLRLTIVRLANDKLWLHALTPLSDELKNTVNELGTVGYLYCGNNFHNTWLADWAKAYPDAEVWVTPGIPAKLPELEGYKIFTGDLWTDDFTCVSMQDVPLFDESVFLHRSSRSLIVTDMVQNHIRRGVFIAPPLLRDDIVKNKDALAEFVNKILAWDFDRIIITPGHIIEDSAKEEFRRITEPLCPTPE